MKFINICFSYIGIHVYPAFMNRIYSVIFFSILSLISSYQGNNMQKIKSERKNLRTEWLLSDLVAKTNEGIQIKGKPGIVNYKDNQAISFNGSSDAVFLESMPLNGFEQFTIEVIFRPASSGNFEQRFLHCGEVQGDRVMLELRSTVTDWYFDAFIKTGASQHTLIEPGLLHPLDQWYHLAFVIDHGKLETFVNKKKELDAKIEMTPLKNGKTSIGVRQNEVSWFKGAIYKIRITPEALKPSDFMLF
jgi:hypothetical protein